AGSSREFWMFVGSLVFLLSALIVVVATCVPIWNKALGLIHELGIMEIETKISPPKIKYYSDTHVWVAIMLGLLSCAVQWLRFKKSDIYKSFKYISVSLGIAAGLTGVTAFMFEIYQWQYVIMLYAAFYATASELAYIIRVLK